ncbi:MAG TPA: hypothetical protein VMK84_24055, partial [Streptosporangiaceae bacterium]|nr:hypothetical protein [Streptosporangiaceae bacterium]
PHPRSGWEPGDDADPGRGVPAAPGTQGNGPGQAVVCRVAEATIQAFLNRVAAAITAQGPASEWNGGTRGQSGSAPPAAQAP